MVATIAMSGVIAGILAAAFALLSGLSVLGVILAYCLTGSVAAILIAAALALRPGSSAADDAGETQTA